MSSEAAQKAYPKEVYGSFAPYMHEGFDRGAVEALRQAAEKLPYFDNSEAISVRALLRMADEWERGSA